MSTSGGRSDGDDTALETRFVITGGGPVSPEEVAALVIALTPVRREDDQEPQMSGWRRAALLEAIGGRPSISSADVVGRERWG